MRYPRTSEARFTLDRSRLPRVASKVERDTVDVDRGIALVAEWDVRQQRRRVACLSPLAERVEGMRMQSGLLGGTGRKNPDCWRAASPTRAAGAQGVRVYSSKPDEAGHSSTTSRLPGVVCVRPGNRLIIRLGVV